MDNLQSDDESNDGQEAEVSMRRVDTTNNRQHRFSFCVGAREIYQWEQSLDEVTIYIPKPPEGRIRCQIDANQLILGVVGVSEDFIAENFPYPVDTRESTWTIEDMDVHAGLRTQTRTMICIYLHKANKGIVWSAPLLNRFGVTLNNNDVDQVKQELMRQRWGEENPGFDFRDAEFNGSAPDPRTFMNGVSYG